MTLTMFYFIFGKQARHEEEDRRARNLLDQIEDVPMEVLEDDDKEIEESGQDAPPDEDA
jgi:hypothetical protein